MLVAMGSRQRLHLLLVAVALGAGLLWILIDGAPGEGPTSLDVGGVEADTVAGGVSEFAADSARAAAGARSEAAAPHADMDEATAPGADARGRAAITGRVVDEFGNGIAGVGLLARRGSTTCGSAVTDANGAFAFDDLGPGLYFVGSTADFWDALDLVPEAGADRQRLASLRVVEMRAHPITIRCVRRATLVVRVEDGGAPVSAVQVELRPSTRQSANVFDAPTDAAGEALFVHLAPGPYGVDVDVPGPDPLVTAVDVVAGRTQRVVVAVDDLRGAVLRGRVVDLGGEPVPGLVLAAHALGRSGHDPLPHEATGADGRFELGRLAAGRYVLTPDVASGAATPQFDPPLEPIDVASADVELGDLVATWGDGFCLTGSVSVDPSWFADEIRDPEHASIVFELIDPGLDAARPDDAGASAVDRASFGTRGTAPWRGHATFAFSSGQLPVANDATIWRPVLRARVTREFADPVPYEATFDVTIERGRHVHLDVSLP